MHTKVTALYFSRHKRVMSHEYHFCLTSGVQCTQVAGSQISLYDACVTYVHLLLELSLFLSWLHT